MPNKPTPKAANDKGGALTVNVELSVREGQEAPAVRVYLFDAAGRLVHSTPASNKAVLPIDPTQRYRVTVGPDFIQQRDTTPSDLAGLLARANAVSQDYLPQSRVSVINVVLQESLWLRWLFVCMNIHGSVRKLLNPGGTPTAYAPICTGTVQIFTIDLRASLGNLSDSEMLALKNQVLARLVSVEIADLFSWNFADFARVSALAAGLFPLSGNPLRDYIATNRAALAPFMCNIIPEWAISYQPLPDAQIQSDGTFSLSYCFLRWQTPPDIYFEVVQTIDGVQREVSDPDIVCTTMWGYDGSEGAVITVDDPTAIACQPTLTGPGYLYVWPTAIGNTPLSLIDGLETLTGTGLLPGGPIGTPWGGTMSLQMQFDPNLRANNIHYYRWSYQFAGDANFTQIHSTVVHRWQDVTFTGGLIDIRLHSETLGPLPVGGESNLFEIPDPNLEWINIVDPADRPFAYFDSTAAQTPGRSGMVTLMLEMFDAAGVHVPCSNSGHGGPFTFILPQVMGVDEFTDAPAPNIDASGNLIFKVLVDNNPTVASFPGLPVHIGASHADDCGMLHYTGAGDTVTIDYVATQPNNYLSWELSVNRGSHGQVATTSGDVSSLNPDHFDNSAGSLVGTCVQAAFAANLATYARATDGYGRQSQYDRSASIAFALLRP